MLCIYFPPMFTLCPWSLSAQVFEALQMQSDEERDLHTTLSRPHMQKLMSVHDIVRSRSYETPVPQFDPTWHPQTNYDRHMKRGKGKGPEYRTVGLHKSANEPLVSVSVVSPLVHYSPHLSAVSSLGLCTSLVPRLSLRSYI